MMEYCTVETSDTDIRIAGTIVGFGEDTPFSVNYDIIADRLWQVSSLEMAVEKNADCSWISLKRDPDGKWTQSGHIRPEWQQCIDIDISLTPFTNTLPINRLRLEANERTELNVLYINILRDEIRPVKQWYTKLNDKLYRYEGVVKDFKAEIGVDEDGLVTVYPEIFSRIPF